MVGINAASIKLDTKELDRLTKEIEPRANAIIRSAAFAIEGKAKTNVTSQGLVDTGALINSIHAERKDKFVWHVSVSVEYAAIHEFGGHITAKKSKFLAIPLPGVEGEPRDFKLHVVVFGGIVAALVDDSGKVMFILKKSVFIPARPYLVPAVEWARPLFNTMWRGLFK